MSGRVKTATEAPERIPISTLKADPRNPRSITDRGLAGLGVSAETFGDISGIVFNTRTSELVGGHQRVKLLAEGGATEVVCDTETTGYIQHPKTGERFSVRFVDWDETKQRLGNLTANNPHIQGAFTGGGGAAVARNRERGGCAGA